MSRSPSPLLSLLFAAAILTACPKRVTSPTSALEAAAEQAASGNAPARAFALAGFHAWLLASDPKLAEERFTQALASDANDPYALYGQLLVAQRKADPSRAIDAATELFRRAPAHPLATVAARRILGGIGMAPALDERIEARAKEALASGADGDTAFLLRQALFQIHDHRGQFAEAEKDAAEAGLITRFTLLGPYAAFPTLDFDEPFGPEKTGALEGTTGAHGPLSPRELTTADGRVNLSAEVPDADLYYLAADVEVTEPGAYLVRTTSTSAHKLFLDGHLVFERRAFERTSSTTTARALSLGAGRHRVLVKLLRGDSSGNVGVSLARLDGQPAKLVVSAAKGVAAPAPLPSAPVENPPRLYPSTADLVAALEPEAGRALALYVAISDGLQRDRDGGKRLLGELLPLSKATSLSALSSQLANGDRTVPVKVAKGRATRDLEIVLERDPGDVSALLSAAELALEDGRQIDAAAFLDRARKVTADLPFPALLMEARIQLALNADAPAEAAAKRALEKQPGLCDALSLRYELAQKRDAAALVQSLLEEQTLCPGNLSRRAEHLRAMGQLDAAILVQEKLVERERGDLAPAYALANLHHANRQPKKAVEVLTALRALWPMNPSVTKRLADAHELAGQEEQAWKLREEALAQDGSDLSLRRSLHRKKTGKELLSEYAIDTRAAIAAYETERQREEAASSFVLDSAVVEVFPGGAMVDRIHIIQKALDQSGVQEIAEVNIPDGAQILSLRTVKPDGRFLEPEVISGKDAISLPNVEVGDYVEYEFLQAHRARGPSQPGFAAGSFYFQIARQPDAWAVYRVLAPKGTGMMVDAHNLPPQPVKTEGDREVFFYEVKKSPPFIPEPSSPPSANEFLPFVTVGAGTTGQESLIKLYGDRYLDRGTITAEVEAFAKAAVGELTGLEAIRALHAAVMKRLDGQDSGLPYSATFSLAQDRGSRLWALKASLAAVGISSRLVAVRTFPADPAPYLFPNENLYTYVCLRVSLPTGEQLFIDPLVRFGPFGLLPEQAAGREAYLLPEPGLPLEKIETPKQPVPRGKRITLTLKLLPTGELTGTGAETYEGFEAAQLSEALESMSPDQRDQALQSALSRYFGGANLSSLKVEGKREVGAPLTVSYAFSAPRFARPEGDGRLVLSALTFPAQLGRRFVQLGARRTDLFIDSSESNETDVTLELPEGFTIKDVQATLGTEGKYGKLTRTEALEGRTFTVRESFELRMARVPPADYEDFGRFAGEVDLLQSRDYLAERK